jgi:hypothetical protein
LQETLAFRVLPQSGGALARPGIQVHQALVRRLVQRVQGQPAPGETNGRLVLVARAVTAYQLFQRSSERLPQALCLKELPLVKGNAVRQTKAFQQVSPA